MIPERSDSERKAASVRAEGRHVNLELPGTSLTRFNVDVNTLNFTNRVVPKSSEPVHDNSAVFERIAAIQRESLERFDDDIVVLTKYLKIVDAPNEVMKVLETLSNEQHASWLAAVERIEELLEE
ncbi:hypothetical protein RBB79_17900 [Tunturiibacter empetritectus]|uniref:hypothetical protein n=1 Tax=Tunturiibacter empetritectus TaxID=3069691 RepID=UPI0015C91934